MHLSNPVLLLTPIQRREALRSSSLEGTFSTPEELLLFELESETNEPDTANSQREVNNYAIALRNGAFALDEYPLSMALVREMHKLLLTGTRGEDKGQGEIRNTQVHIGAGRRFIPPPPVQVVPSLEKLELFLKRGAVEFGCHPLIACYMLHYQFETIHPFRDGNGRIGRLLLALTTWKWCEYNLPWLYMSPYFEKYKDEYIQNLFNVSAKGDWQTWLKFCLIGTVEQANDTVLRIKELTALKENMLARIELSNSVRLVKLIDYLFDKPVLTAPVAKTLCEVSIPTARQDIATLEKVGILSRLKTRKKPIVYFAGEIFDIAYREDS